MGSKIVNLEIFLIYFLLLIPWPHTHVIKRLCSKDSSRLVRKIVRSKWTPILDKYQVKLPLECPLHPFRDIFAPRQDAKKRDRPTQWTCRLCGKSFYQEKFLDLHFETRHKAIINEAEDAVCLADYCDIMRCEVFQTEESSSLKIGDQNIVTDIEVWGDSFGQNSALAKANVAYLSLLPIRTSSIGASRAAKVQNRQLCQDKIGQTKCQQTETSNENYIYSTNNNNNGASRTKYTPHIQTPAESLTSSAAPHIYSSSSSSSSSSGASRSQKTYSTTSSSSTSNSAYSSGSGTSGSGTTSTSSNTKESTSHHADGGAEHNTRTENSNSDDSVKTQTNTSDDDERSKTSGNNGQMSTMQKIRANCKAEELIKLKSKCEFLVRTCIGGLILSMSDQQFRDMEEEMNKAVCWYLTCERYWEDGPLEPRAFPWGLIVILIFVLSSGICFCYYIIWILFDFLLQLRRGDNQCQHERQSSLPYTANAAPTSATPAAAATAASSAYLYTRQPSTSAATSSIANSRSLSFSRVPYYRDPSPWYEQRRASEQQQHQSVLLPSGPGRGRPSRYVPRTSAIRLSSQPQALHRRSASAGYPDYDGHRTGDIRHSKRWRTDSTASSDESGLPTGHFRPTRLYK
ncbi:uncharacterized protein LOC106082299 isoform X2 [Stomoxys calcitrans]|uniref:uncharacterized protein LOC106082299 isoform X2 n=1 Tax=Stomoxys calcitrans TaxID=35570 RepID=UPI0027E30030|nr:uncharacterized protein LOC106082299 isoform X2 [Stomoxys calcitrans]